MSQRFASFWHGGDLSPHAHLCIKSFLDFGHEFHLYTFDRRLRVPSGCQLRDAADFYSEDEVFYYRGGTKVSAFSNMFRYRMIYETGVCWVDTDVLCMTENFPEAEYIFARQDKNFFNGAVLRLPLGHEAMHLAAEYCWELRESSNWGDLGPRLLTKVIAEYGLEAKGVATSLIYPIHWREAMWALDPEQISEVMRRSEGALTFHLWNEVFCRNGVDNRVLPLDGSFLANAIVRHDVESLFLTQPWSAPMCVDILMEGH